MSTTILKYLSAIFLLLIICFVFSNFTEPKEQHYLCWNDRNTLTWKDYRIKKKGKAGIRFGGMGVTVAHTISFFAIEYSDTKDSMFFNVRAKFDYSRSWACQKDTTDSLLLHEQIHFDITELFARQVRDSIRKFYLNSDENTKPLNIRKLGWHFVLKHTKYDREYDREVYGDGFHNSQKQKDWISKIKNKLLMTQNLGDPVVRISFQY